MHGSRAVIFLLTSSVKIHSSEKAGYFPPTILIKLSFGEAGLTLSNSGRVRRLNKKQKLVSWSIPLNIAR